MKLAAVCLLLTSFIAAIVSQPVYENTFCMQRRCPYDEDFRCRITGVCIRSHLVCDGISDCADCSDEENCVYHLCQHGHGCDGGKICYPLYWVCDGFDDCTDLSDERSCLSGACPYASDVKCNDTGVCLGYTSVCDGYKHCTYGNDEQNCDLKQCPYDDDHRCTEDNSCIREEFVCDRRNSCKYGSDEINCEYRCPYDGDIECGNNCYRSHQFCDMYQHCHDNTAPNCSTIPCPYIGDYRCPLSGICVRSYQVCDGSSDCPNGEDEQNCTSINCPHNMWWCTVNNNCYSANDACFNSNLRSVCGSYNCRYSCSNANTQVNSYVIDCNGINDCTDGSDEANCYNIPCPGVNDFRCSSTGACIRQAQVCDGVIHCSDGSDEINCAFIICSIPGDVKCRDNGSCIHSDMICNGINDCMDGSDEDTCASRPCPYVDDRRCNSSLACIRADRWCDGWEDCTDQSDEEDCYVTSCPYTGDFRCVYNGLCIRSTSVCDGHEDCLDDSDEGMNYCPEVFTMGIQWEHTLTKTISTHKCSDIHPSFKLSDVITRECMKNKTWVPVNMSQCVMISDSPVVMIIVVSLQANSVSLVESKQDIIVQEIKEAIINHPAVHVEVMQSVSNANVSLKIIFEFFTFTTAELVETINYETSITTLGNFSVVAAPQLAIFESTDVCQCPDGITSSTVSTDMNDSVSIEILSICSGKPCDCDSSLPCQCVTPFVGDGKVCGKDSDGDGYPDMQLNCDDSHCV